MSCCYSVRASKQHDNALSLMFPELFTNVTPVHKHHDNHSTVMPL